MVQKCPKWSEMVQNGLKKVQNGLKWSKKGPKWSKVVQKGHKWSEIVKNGLDWHKSVQNGPQEVQDGLKRSKTVIFFYSINSLLSSSGMMSARVSAS